MAVLVHDMLTTTPVDNSAFRLMRTLVPAITVDPLATVLFIVTVGARSVNCTDVGDRPT
jgi:hypothetical protein